jgi:hypothetical protein
MTAGGYRVTLPLTKAGDNAITILVNDQVCARCVVLLCVIVRDSRSAAHCGTCW